jgi:hypothetical protein
MVAAGTMNTKPTTKTATARPENVQLWQDEFGDAFKPEGEILTAIEEGRLLDTSWHNDVMPSFCPPWDDGSTLRLWSDAAKREDRECPEGGNRYCVQVYDEGAWVRDILTTNCVTSALYAFEIAELALRPVETSEGNAPRETFQDIARDLGYDPQDIVAAGQEILAQRDELLAAAKRVEAGWNITNRKTLASAMAHLRAAIAKAEQH